MVLSLTSVNSHTVKVVTTQHTYLNDNRNANDYSDYDWTKPVYNYLVKVEKGYMRVHLKKDGTTYIEYFDENFKFVSQIVIETELSMSGGFYEGKENYFLVFGQENESELDSVEVIRVVKYDKEWRRIASASVYGANTREPFHSGAVRMAESNGQLYIRTSHLMYKSSGGINHQANMTIVVNEADMTIADEESDIVSYSKQNRFNMAYVSHSFNQFVIGDDNGDIVFLDQGDGFPRAAQLAKETREKWGEDKKRYIVCYEGSCGDNETGASIGGLEYSCNNYLTVGTAGAHFDWDYYDQYIENYLYLSINDKQLQRDSNIIYIGHSDINKFYSTPQLVKISVNKFMILWTERVLDKEEMYVYDGFIRYVYVDGEGNLLSDIFQTKGYLSDCQPISVDDKVIWTTEDNNNLTFHVIDSSGAYYSKIAGYPSNMIKYPINIAKCHLVAKKIGTIPYEEDNENDIYTDYFDLFSQITDELLVYGYDYIFQGRGGTKVSDEEYYLRSISCSAKGEDYYGSKTFAARSSWSENSEFIFEVPRNVSASKTSSGITIKWKKEPYALGYYVYRKCGNSSYKKIATITDVSKNIYVDKNVKKNNAYKYYIRTFTTNGEKLITSQKSNIVTIK